MQTQRSFLDELRALYKSTMFMKLILMNVVIFFLIQIVVLIGDAVNAELAVARTLAAIFAMPTGLADYLTHPWSIITSMFAHFEFFHVLLNMFMLFYVGRIFEQIYQGRTLLYTYLLGGFAGGATEIIVHLIAPEAYGEYYSVVGASGAIMALFIMLAFSRPQMKVLFFGVIPMRLIWLALIFIAMDFLRLGTNDGVAHFAHLGGALIGFLGSQNVNSSSNIIQRFQRFGDRVVKIFQPRERTRLKVKRGPEVRNMTDEEYNADATLRQKEIDRILDKISKSGYESLSKREKDFLFNQSK